MPPATAPMPAPIMAALLLSPISAPRPAPTAAPAPAPTAVRPPVLIPLMPSLTLAQPASSATENRHAAVRFKRVDVFIFSSPGVTVKNLLMQPNASKRTRRKCDILIRPPQLPWAQYRRFLRPRRPAHNTVPPALQESFGLHCLTRGFGSTA